MFLFLFSFLCVILSLISPVLSREDPNYSFESGWRPTNITGLNKYYDQTGSYFNGTLKFTLEVLDLNQNNKKMGYRTDGTSGCSLKINSTIEISVNALGAITMHRHHPLVLQIWSWADGEDLLNSTNVDLEGREYKFWYFFTNGVDSWGGRHRNISSEPSLSAGYSFSGEEKNSILPWPPELAFNLTNECSGARTIYHSNSDDYLYSGSMLFPRGNDSYATKIDDWAHFVPKPRVTGNFDNATMSAHISGLFYMKSESNLPLVGRIRVDFSGKIDPLRSDQLLQGEPLPKWNATLGFGIDSVLEIKAKRVYFSQTNSCTFGIGMLVVLYYFAT